MTRRSRHREADPPRLRGARPVVAADGDENGPGPRVRIPALAVLGRPVRAQAERLGVEDEDPRPAPGRELMVDLGSEQIEVAGGEVVLPARVAHPALIRDELLGLEPDRLARSPERGLSLITH